MTKNLEEVKSMGSPSKQSAMNATITTTEKEPDKPYIASEYLEQSLEDKEFHVNSSNKSDLAE